MGTHLGYMQRAFELAQLAKQHDEVPVGAVIVYEDKIIGEGWNQPIKTSDPTAHAEIIALRQAGVNQNNYRLLGADLYVTLEPCCMCAGAMIHARINKVIFAASDPKTGACGGKFNLLNSDEHNHQVQIEQGLMEQECKTLLQDFFREKRARS